MTEHHWLVDYCCSQSGLFVIPIDALSPAGIDGAFSDALVENGTVCPNWIARFDHAYRLYWERTQAMRSRAPKYWFAPRLQHVCVVTRPEGVRPYFQPFHRSSWLLYQGDFEPATSSVEFSVFLFMQAERMGLMGEIVPALHANLPYFLTLSARQRKEFRQGCAHTERPDAGAFRVLADALPWLKTLYHEQFRRPRIALPRLRIHKENGLIVPQSHSARVRALQEAWGDAAREVFAAYRRRYAGASGDLARGLGHWLMEHQPQALITGSEGAVLWNPERAGEQDDLRRALTAMTPAGAERIKEDLAVIDRHTRRFLASLAEPESLAEPAPYLTEGGLSYINAEHGLIAYDIGPGRNESRLWEPSPPYERLMLGARTVHEWGHLAAESGWVLVPEEHSRKRLELTERLAALFDELLAGAPPAVRDLTRPETVRLERKYGSMGQGLLAAMLRRIEDYMANLVASRFLDADEMDTYVRNNVASRVGQYRPGEVYMQLIRMAYEYQYLGLSRITRARRWYYASTWIEPLFFDAGVVTREQFETIVETVAGICSCYAVDRSKFNFASS